MEEGECSPIYWALNDVDRIDALNATGLLDSAPEAAFDRLTELASHLLNVPVTLVSLVDTKRQFFKSQVGQAEPLRSRRETPLSHSFCKHVVAEGKPLIVPDARKHPLLFDNPAVAESNVIAYLGIPMMTGHGHAIGSFCAIDSEPREWTEADIQVMQRLAESVMTEVELRVVVRHLQESCLRQRNLELERQEMVQMLVHDLRNPLSALLMGLTAVQIDTLPTFSQNCLRNAQAGATTLHRMINDILDVSKSEAGKTHLELEEISARELVQSSCASIHEMVREAGVALSIHIRSSVPRFRADAEKLRRTLVNLIANAVQHTPTHGQVNITVRCDKRSEKIVFEIADNGTGIPKEAFAHIFEKFHRARMPKVPKASTGLGLPFCKMAIEAHGGSIMVESELGKGTTFRAEIPMRLPNSALEKAAA
jgi:signal transduction histidine kinase